MGYYEDLVENMPTNHEKDSCDLWTLRMLKVQLFVSGQCLVTDHKLAPLHNAQSWRDCLTLIGDDADNFRRAYEVGMDVEDFILATNSREWLNGRGLLAPTDTKMAKAAAPIQVAGAVEADAGLVFMSNVAVERGMRLIDRDGRFTAGPPMPAAGMTAAELEAAEMLGLYYHPAQPPDDASTFRRRYLYGDEGKIANECTP